MVVQDLIGFNEDIIIEPEWPIQQFKMDKDGNKIVMLSQDGMYVFVYSLLEFKGSEKPIQRFYFEKKPCSQMYQMEIINFKIENYTDIVNHIDKN